MANTRTTAAKKTPQDRRPAKKKADTAVLAGEPFPFEWPHGSGQMHELAPFGQLPGGLFRRAIKAGDEAELEYIFEALEISAVGDALDALDEMPLTDMMRVYGQWQDASGVTAGE